MGRLLSQQTLWLRLAMTRWQTLWLFVIARIATRFVAIHNARFKKTQQ
ncbi:hypothetical protein [Helicobacter rodentium]|nr:hypothetical protein [Helicobacter rodentium]